MRVPRFPAVAFCLALAAGSAPAQSGDWQKSYPASGGASLSLATGDASVELHGCGGCGAIGIHVNWRDRNPNEFEINEFQTGGHVNFELKEKPRMGFRIGHFREPEVTVETPEKLDLEARTSDGSLRIAGINGTLELHTSDGSVDVSDVGGAMRLTASDGAIRLHNVTGALESRSSDGSVTIDGKFSGLQVHAGDGRMDVTLAEGTQLTTASRIEGSDGRMTVRLPKSLAVDLDVHTSDGGIDCQLPLTMDGYNSAHNSGHNLRGHLNGGGTPLTIHASDGNVTIAAL